mgnify:CR=1 FL=1
MTTSSETTRSSLKYELDGSPELARFYLEKRHLEIGMPFSFESHSFPPHCQLVLSELHTGLKSFQSFRDVLEKSLGENSAVKIP